MRKIIALVGMWLGGFLGGVAVTRAYFITRESEYIMTGVNLVHGAVSFDMGKTWFCPQSETAK